MKRGLSCCDRCLNPLQGLDLLRLETISRVSQVALGYTKYSKAITAVHMLLGCLRLNQCGNHVLDCQVSQFYP